MDKKIIAALFMCIFTSFGFLKADALVVGTNAEFPPFTFIEKGEIVGFDIDIAKEVGKHLDKSITFKDMPFDALIPDAVLGHVDFVAAGMSYTEERAKRVSFTKPYLSGDPLVVLTFQETPVTLQDLVDKSVVVNEGFTADMLLSSKKGIHLVRLPNTTDAFLAVINKRAFAFVTAKSTFDAFCAKQSNSLHAYPIEGTAETCALVVPKSKPELLASIQKALDAMEEDGTLAAIKKKWGLGND